MNAIPTSSSRFDTIYTQVENYPWDADTEFQNGLKTILRSSTSPEEAIELVLRARCFYYSRKFNMEIDFDSYKLYRATACSPSGVPITNTTNGLTPAELATEHTPARSYRPISEPREQQQHRQRPPQSQHEASYPTSFAHIVELIMTGQSISGIKEIQPTVLLGQASVSRAQKRRKPWEQGTDVVLQTDG